MQKFMMHDLNPMMNKTSSIDIVLWWMKFVLGGNEFFSNIDKMFLGKN